MGNNNSSSNSRSSKSQKPTKSSKTPSAPPPSTQKRTTDNQLTTASKTGILNLSNKNLETLPKQITTLTNLRQLNLSKNKLTTQSAAVISLLPNLQKIDLSYNNLIDFSFICSHSLVKLKTVDLSHNNINFIPKDPISKSIKKIDLSFNKLIDVQVQIGNSNFYENLQNLDFSWNQITVVPDAIASFTTTIATSANATAPDTPPKESSLIEINFNNNKLTNLNSSQLLKIKTLKVLRVSNNNLKIVEFSPAFLKESKISTLEYENNNFEGKYFKELEGYEEFEKRMTNLVMKRE